jgi:hypothetical protein
MKRGIPEHKEAQAAVLARMAATRAERFCRSKERGANEIDMTSTAYVANE